MIMMMMMVVVVATVQCNANYVQDDPSVSSCEGSAKPPIFRLKCCRLYNNLPVVIAEQPS